MNEKSMTLNDGNCTCLSYGSTSIMADFFVM